MINFTLATTFANIAEAGKQHEGGFDTVMALTRASRTIRDYTDDIGQAYRDGLVKNMPGITPQIYKLIEEYFETGKIKSYEEFKSLYSEDLIKFVRISGLGAKRVFHIYNVLGVKDIDGLRQKVDSGEIYKKILNDFNPGKEEITKNYLERFIYSLDYYQGTANLFPKGYIDFFIDKIKNSILNLKDIRFIQVAGSVRRKKPFIKDIDLLVMPDFNDSAYDFSRSEKLLKQIQGLEFIRKRKSFDKRAQNLSAKYSTSYEIDIEVIVSSGQNLPLDLFYATGSKNHIETVEELAAKQEKTACGKITAKSLGLAAGAGRGFEIKGFEETALNNTGLQSVKSSIEPADAIVYKMLGMQYIPPELREGNQEVGQAKENLLPNLIELSDILGDMHVHSYFSDGMIEINDLIEKCKKYNYSYLAITDHSISNKYGNGLSPERLSEKIEFVNDLRRKVKTVNFLIGAEVDINNDYTLDYDDEILSRLDFVLGSMHSNYLNTCQQNTKKVVSAIKNRYVDAIAHPTGVVFSARAPYILDMDIIFENAARYGTALEINSYLLRLDLNDDFARKFKKLGGKLVINTDSHRADNLDMIKLGVEVARRAGLEKGDVINTMSLSELKQWKKERANTGV